MFCYGHSICPSRSPSLIRKRAWADFFSEGASFARVVQWALDGALEVDTQLLAGFSDALYVRRMHAHAVHCRLRALTVSPRPLLNSECSSTCNDSGSWGHLEDQRVPPRRTEIATCCCGR